MTANYCTCPAMWNGIYPPPPCEYCRNWRATGGLGWTYTTPDVTFPRLPPLTDSELDKIAEKVVEKLAKRLVK